MFLELDPKTWKNVPMLGQITLSHRKGLCEINSKISLLSPRGLAEYPEVLRPVPVRQLQVLQDGLCGKNKRKKRKYGKVLVVDIEWLKSEATKVSICFLLSALWPSLNVRVCTCTGFPLSIFGLVSNPPLYVCMPPEGRVYFRNRTSTE